MVEVCRFETRREAELARSLLTAAGIPAVLASGGTGPFPLDLSGEAHLLVADADADAAAAILRALLGRPRQPPSESDP